MRLFQILSFGTELVDELFFFLIMKPVYMCLCGWFLSFLVHLSFQCYFLTILFSSLIPSLLLRFPPDRPQQSLFIFWFLLPPITFPSWLFFLSALLQSSIFPYLMYHWLFFSLHPFFPSHVCSLVSFQPQLSAFLCLAFTFFLTSFFFVSSNLSFLTNILPFTVIAFFAVFFAIFSHFDSSLPQSHIPFFTDCSLEFIFRMLILRPFIINVPFPNVFPSVFRLFPSNYSFRNGFIFHILTETETLI